MELNKSNGHRAEARPAPKIGDSLCAIKVWTGIKSPLGEPLDATSLLAVFTRLAMLGMIIWVFAGLFLMMGIACGLKAAPKPREVVVPTAVNDLTVRMVPAGIEVAFTLPSTSLDGSRLRELGGYRITRKGEKTAEIRKEVRFSISERRREVGKSIVFIDTPPIMAGSYYYNVTPFDIYGSHPRSSSDTEGVLLLWEGLLQSVKDGEKQTPHE